MKVYLNILYILIYLFLIYLNIDFLSNISSIIFVSLFIINFFKNIELILFGVINFISFLGIVYELFQGSIVKIPYIYLSFFQFSLIFSFIYVIIFYILSNKEK